MGKRDPGPPSCERYFSVMIVGLQKRLRDQNLISSLVNCLLFNFLLFSSSLFSHIFWSRANRLFYFVLLCKWIGRGQLYSFATIGTSQIDAQFLLIHTFCFFWNRNFVCFNYFVSIRCHEVRIHKSDISLRFRDDRVQFLVFGAYVFSKNTPSLSESWFFTFLSCLSTSSFLGWPGFSPSMASKIDLLISEDFS